MNEYQNLTIKDWASEDRPREKLLAKGIASLSDAELLAILLATGTKNLSAVDLAKQILASVGNNLHVLGKQTVNDLKKINGIGEAKAIAIIAALEIGRRRKRVDLEREKANSSKVVFELFQPILGDLPYEEFWVIYLNRSNGIIGKERISSGGTVGTVIDVKIILKHGIEKLSAGLILVHNHPSGNFKPSENDKQITKKIKDAAILMDISTLDHIIIGDTKYYSFADEGLLT
ncbi:MAG: DNA repair protein RadC [Salinivirgaceae bacterium]|jgi:DNA repair protein RadC|nr:DNA repair protein RadC [Salinivirgaceae bacterium]